MVTKTDALIEPVDIEKVDIAEFDAKEYISASQMTGAELCLTRWADGILHRDKQPASGPAAFGDAEHLVIEILSKRAVDLHDGYTAKLTLEEVIKEWERVIALYPALVSKDNIERGVKQLTYWYNQEVKRNAKVINVVGILGIEKVFFTYLKNGVLVKGIIDRIETNNHTPEGYIQLIDWKTGFLKDDYTNAMTLYKIAALQLFKDHNIQGIYVGIYQLENEYYEPYVITQNDIEEYTKYVAVVREAINNFAEKIREYVRAKDWTGLFAFLMQQAKFNQWCYACRLSSICSVYLGTVYGYVPGVLPDMEEDKVIAVLIQQKEHVKMIEKAAKKMAENIDRAMIDKISLNKGNPIYLEDESYVELKSNNNRVYDRDTVISLLIDYEMYEYLDFKLGDLDKAVLVMEPADRSKIEDTKLMVKGKVGWKHTEAPKGKKNKIKK